MNQWYYAANGAQQGPVSLDQLNEWVRNGQFPADTLVWRDGMAQWLPANQVAELAAAFGGGGQGGHGVAAQPQQAYGDPAQYGAAAGYGAAQQASPLGYAQPQSAYGYNGFRYGGFWWRVLAYIIDTIILYVPHLIINKAMSAALENGPRADPGSPEFWSILGTTMVVTQVVDWLYYALQESSAAQATIGKRVCGLVVTDLNSQRLTFGRATGRYFGKILSSIILLIGYIMVAFTEKKQGLHDQLAGTLVWKKP